MGACLRASMPFMHVLFKFLNLPTAGVASAIAVGIGVHHPPSISIFNNILPTPAAFPKTDMQNPRWMSATSLQEPNNDVDLAKLKCNHSHLSVKYPAYRFMGEFKFN